MNRTPSPIFHRLRGAALGALLLSTLLPLKAAEVQWTATGSRAWATGANWSGGAVPGAGDLAQFTGVLGGNIGIQYSAGTVLERSVGAISLTSVSDKAYTIGHNGAGSNGTLTFHGQTVGGIARTFLHNASAMELHLASQTAVTHTHQIAFATAGDQVVKIDGAGDIRITATINGGTSRLVLAGGGTGRLILGATHHYSGGTLVDDGQHLRLEANGAVGSGVIDVGAGRVQLAAGVAQGNVISLNAATAIYGRDLAIGQGYGGWSVRSGLAGGRGTQAALLAGNNAGARTLEVSFSLAAPEAPVVSDLLELSVNSPGEVFVLQLQLNEAVGGDHRLAWLDNGEWKLAVDGNSAIGTLAQVGVEGSYAASGLMAQSDYLGSWGFDSQANTLWAIVDHDGIFAATTVVPEPTSLALLGVGLLLGIAHLRRR